MIFLTVEGEIEDGDIKITVLHHLSRLDGLPAESIGRCAVIANHVAGAIGMVLQNGGALLQPTIDQTGGDDGDTDKAN